MPAAEAAPAASPFEVYQDLVAEAWRGAQELAGVTSGPADPSLPFREYQDDLAAFGRRVLGHRYWPGQAAIPRALLKHRLVSVRSSKKTGKTFVAGDMVLGFIATAPTTLITTGSGGRQVKELIWSKSAEAHASSRVPLPGTLDTQSYRISGEWKAIGFATDDPVKVQGFHGGIGYVPDEEADELAQELAQQADKTPGALAEKLLAPRRRLVWIVDEAVGVQGPIWDVIDASLSGDNVYCLVLSNPTIAADDPHFFAKQHRPGSGWYRMHIAARPFPLEWDTIGAEECYHDAPEEFCPQSWVEKCKRDWGGEDSPLFRSLVLGLFAETDDTVRQVVPSILLESALARGARSAQGRHIGIDIACSPQGDDAVASLWVDGIKAAEHTWRGYEPMQTAELIQALSLQWGENDPAAPHGKRPIPGSQIHVDKSGLGVGVTSRLRQLGLFVDAVDFGEAACGDWSELTGETIFKNRRAELHWIYRRVFEEGLGHLPRKWEQSWSQAQWPRYEMKGEGSRGTQILIQPKEEIRARYGRSPDHLDSDLLAWARGVKIPTFGRMPWR